MRYEARLRYASAQPDTARAPTVEIVAGSPAGEAEPRPA
jgi:hypothetical protein